MRKGFWPKDMNVTLKGKDKAYKIAAKNCVKTQALRNRLNPFSKKVKETITCGDISVDNLEIEEMGFKEKWRERMEKKRAKFPQSKNPKLERRRTEAIKEKKEKKIKKHEKTKSKEAEKYWESQENEMFDEGNPIIKDMMAQEVWVRTRNYPEMVNLMDDIRVKHQKMDQQREKVRLRQFAESPWVTAAKSSGRYKAPSASAKKYTEPKPEKRKLTFYSGAPGKGTEGNYPGPSSERGIEKTISKVVGKGGLAPTFKGKKV